MHLDSPLTHTLLAPDPLVVIEQKKTLWVPLPTGAMTTHQIDLVEAIKTIYPDAKPQMRGERVLVHTDEHGHFLIKPDGSYQWATPDGLTITVPADCEINPLVAPH